MCICVVCGSENKQRLFPYTALTGFYNQDGVCLLRGTDWIFIYNPLKPTGHYMYRRFNIHKFYVLPTQRICVLCGSENKQRLFPYTALTGFYNQDGVCLLRGTDWIFIYNPLKPTGHYMYH